MAFDNVGDGGSASGGGAALSSSAAQGSCLPNVFLHHQASHHLLRSAASEHVLALMRSRNMAYWSVRSTPQAARSLHGV
eukprot:2069161-Alexandrium_andersonii.AAC.1